MRKTQMSPEELLAHMVRTTPPDKITVEFQRDASLRVTEVVIVNHNHAGNERQGVRFMCHDNGDITMLGGPVNLIEGVDIL